MSQVQVEQRNFSYIASLLNEQKINKIVIIDDAYDSRERSEFESEIIEFWAEVQGDDKAYKELCSYGFDGDSPEDITDELLEKLWVERKNLTALKEPCEKKLFIPIFQKYEPLECFRSYLEGDLACAVRCIGRMSDLEDIFTDNSVKLIFIDYYLGPTPKSTVESYLEESTLTIEQRIEARENAASKAAEDKIKEIYRQYPNNKPLVILMSSDPKVANKKENFRDNSGLIGGMFYFVPKDDLVNKEKLFLRLATWVMTLPVGYKMQNLVNTLQHSVKQVADRFIEEIRKLEVEDYAYIDQLSLQEDGHPLGDYVLWLYNSYFGCLLFESEKTLSEQRKELNKFRFPTMLPTQVRPSLKLVEIYQSALFEELDGDDDLEHPLSKSTNTESPYFQLGDLFIKNTTEDALMVINAQCDLAFTPDGERKMDPNLSIFLIPGNLRPIGILGDTITIRTELFKYGDEAFQIIWDIKRVRAFSYRTVKSFLSTEGYRRVARLRLPFALEVQRAFATNLTRIGMPVPPPIYKFVKVQLFCRDEGGNFESLVESQENLAYLVLSRKGEQCFLTIEFLCLLVTKIDLLVQRLHNLMAALRNEIEQSDSVTERQKKVKERLINRLEKLELCKISHDMSKPFLLPANGMEDHNSLKELFSVSISLSRNKEFRGRYNLENPLLLNIIDISLPSNNPPRNEESQLMKHQKVTVSFDPSNNGV